MDHLADETEWVGAPVWYLFLGGVAAGSYLVAVLVSLLGGEADRRATRGAHYLPLPLVAACAAVGCTIEGWRAGRGAAALAVFGAYSVIAFIEAVPFGDRSPHPPAGSLEWLKGSWIGKQFQAGGAFVAVLFVASTVWTLPNGWVGPAWSVALLLASAATTGTAALVLSARRAAGDGGDEAVVRLGRANAMANVLELAVLTALALSLRPPDGLAFMRWPGMLIPLFVVPVGLVFPLLIGGAGGVRGEVDAALLTLFGGFVFCVAFAGIPVSLSLR